MNKSRALLLASATAVVVGLAGVAGITALAKTPGALMRAAASPAPTFKSNEDPTHEKNESAAQEAAENNGTFHPGPGGPGAPGNHPSNEDPTHEKTETPAREAAENR